PNWGVYKQILKGGMPSFYRQSLGSIAMICLNNIALPIALSVINELKSKQIEIEAAEATSTRKASLDMV
ncbi:MAG: hypothetical protein WBK45_10205, partial [Tepidanaerobacteraceae bacterium]